jgi:L-seryl-tRNA(Ser) seleniumtransferase
MASSKGIYEQLGVRRVINAMGNMTLLGGSSVSPAVMAAMRDANESFVEMDELLEKSGRAIAELVGAEAALITSGCYAAMALAAAAIMAGKDPRRIAQLPDTTGMKNEFLLQATQQYHYQRAVTVPGGKLTLVGDANRVTVEQFRAAIGPNTAGVLYPARLESNEGMLSIPQVVGIARDHGIEVIVDAAAETYPLDRMKWLVSKSGAGAVCFGAKYFNSTTSAGVLCGSRALVEAATLHNFIAYETLDNHAFGRGFKIDRGAVVGTVIALREWFDTDHEAALADQERRLGVVQRALAGIPYVSTEQVWLKRPYLQLRIRLRGAPDGMTLAGVEEKLRKGTPSIRIRLEPDELLACVHLLPAGDEQIVADRLRDALSG